MTNLNELASMVEAATGFDPGLDRRIAEAVFGDSPVIAREYTRSLDAAMTLVPEGRNAGGELFKVEAWDGNGVHAPNVRASAWVPGAARVYAATPALALTAAALRSRAAMGEG